MVVYTNTQVSTHKYYNTLLTLGYGDKNQGVDIKMRIYKGELYFTDCLKYGMVLESFRLQFMIKSIVILDENTEKISRTEKS